MEQIGNTLCYFIVCVLSSPKATSAEALGRVTRTATSYKQAMRKSCLPARIEPSMLQAAGSIPAGRQLYRIACF